MAGWGEPHEPRLDSRTGSTGEVEEAREALRAVGIKGITLADQAMAAAREIERLTTKPPIVGGFVP